MTTINTIEDFLRVVRENEELRSAVRRELMTEEVLALPGQFAVMLKTQDSMLERLDSVQRTQNSMLETQNSMLERLDSIQRTQNSMLETLATVVKEQGGMSRDIAALHGMYRRQHDDLGRFRGNYAIDAARRNRSAISSMFARLRGMRLTKLRVLDSAVLSDMLDEAYEAVDALGLDVDTWNNFDSSDLIVEVTERLGSSQRFYVAVEASFTGAAKDVTRAIDHANILRCATGQDAYAVVASVRLNPNVENLVLVDAAKFLEANDESVALWYPIVEEELEPPDPW